VSFLSNQQTEVMNNIQLRAYTKALPAGMSSRALTPGRGANAHRASPLTRPLRDRPLPV